MTAHAKTSSRPPGEDANAGQIGAQLYQLAYDLEACARDLSGQLSGQLSGMVSQLGVDLRDQSCRIAVVGQVKAGKSSFINALSRKPNLLPTDVNPWTAVVTKIHFGKPDIEDSASFEFFSEEEWQHITGGGRLREIAERLEPGFDSARIHEQLAEIERKAKSRLGEHFPEMLGKHHLFSSVTPDVLERYVTAGGPSMSGSGPHYSDITKSADLFLKHNPFGFPTVLIDTPGTNDPFLVRDEITLSNLESADIYVVVVTAQQPLSNADLNLLRLLQGVQSDRIIMFLNRMDTLAEPVRDSQLALQRVRTILEREFSGADIPLVAGSAKWGLNAILPANAYLDGTLNPGFAAYVDARGIASRQDIESLRPNDDSADHRLSEILHRASGIADLNMLIGDVMLRSAAARKTAETASILATLSGNAAVMARFALGGPAKGAGDVTRQDHFATQARLLAEEFRNFESEFLALGQECADSLASTTRDAVRSLARAERDTIEAQIRSGERIIMPRIDTIGLRHRLAGHFLSAYQRAAERLRAFEAEALDRLSRRFAGAVPDLDGILSLGAHPKAPPMPSLSPLAQAVALDLDEPRSYAWAQHSRDPRTAAAELSALIEAEFMELAGELIDATKRTLERDIASKVRRYRIMLHETLEALNAVLQSRAGNATGTQANHAANRAQACERLAKETARLHAEAVALLDGPAKP
jgi:hypothetical protein